MGSGESEKRFPNRTFAGAFPGREVGGGPSLLGRYGEGLPEDWVPQTARPHPSRVPSAHQGAGRPLRTAFASRTYLALDLISAAAAAAGARAKPRAFLKQKRSDYPPCPGGSGSDVRREGRRAWVAPFSPISTSTISRGGAWGVLASSARAAPGRDVAAEG